METTQTILSIMFLSAFLGGCSTLSSSDSGCMKTVLVSTLSKAPLYPAIEEDMRMVTISDFKGGCGGSSAGLPGKKGDIGITMTLTMPGAKRKHGPIKKVVFPIFVALLDQEDNVLDRQDEKVELTISDHSLVHTHKIIYHPLQGIDGDREDYRILVGFNGSAMRVPYSGSWPSVKHKKTNKRKLKPRGMPRKIVGQ